MGVTNFGGDEVVYSYEESQIIMSPYLMTPPAPTYVGPTGALPQYLRLRPPLSSMTSRQALKRIRRAFTPCHRWSTELTLPVLPKQYTGPSQASSGRNDFLLS